MIWGFTQERDGKMLKTFVRKTQTCRAEILYKSCCLKSSKAVLDNLRNPFIFHKACFLTSEALSLKSSKSIWDMRLEIIFHKYASSPTSSSRHPFTSRLLVKLKILKSWGIFKGLYEYTETVSGSHLFFFQQDRERCTSFLYQRKTSLYVCMSRIKSPGNRYNQNHTD